MGDDPSVAVELRYIREDLDEIKTSLKEIPRGYVTRAEWELRNAHDDSVHSSIRHELNRKHAPWWAVGALGVAALSVIISIAQSITP